MVIATAAPFRFPPQAQAVIISATSLHDGRARTAVSFSFVFAFCPQRGLPKLLVGGSIPVSRSTFQRLDQRVIGVLVARRHRRRRGRLSAASRRPGRAWTRLTEKTLLPGIHYQREAGRACRGPPRGRRIGLVHRCVPRGAAAIIGTSRGSSGSPPDERVSFRHAVDGRRIRSEAPRLGLGVPRHGGAGDRVPQ